MSKPQRRAKRAGYIASVPRCKTCARFVAPVMRMENSTPTTATPPTCALHGCFVKRSGWCREWTPIF